MFNDADDGFMWFDCDIDMILLQGILVIHLVFFLSWDFIIVDLRYDGYLSM